MTANQPSIRSDFQKLYMNANEFALSPKTIAEDFLSGIIVYSVALPLCLGIAIGSDADQMRV